MDLEPPFWTKIVFSGRFWIKIVFFGPVLGRKASMITIFYSQLLFVISKVDKSLIPEIFDLSKPIVFTVILTNLGPKNAFFFRP